MGDPLRSMTAPLFGVQLVHPNCPRCRDLALKALAELRADYQRQTTGTTVLDDHPDIDRTDRLVSQRCGANALRLALAGPMWTVQETLESPARLPDQHPLAEDRAPV